MVAQPNPLADVAADLLKGVTFYASFDKEVKGDFGGGELTLSTRFNHKTEKGAFVFERDFRKKAFRIAPAKGISGGALEAVDVLPDNGRIFFPAKGNIAYKKGAGAARSRSGSTTTPTHSSRPVLRSGADHPQRRR